MSDADTLRRLAGLREDLPSFARQCLNVRTKAGEFVKLEFNAAQREIDRRLEAQKAEKGWVRALILKGRQAGCSTYIAARFYHKTSLFRGQNTYILAHEQPASDTLFGIVDRYQRGNPLAPHVGASNAKILEFDRLDSSYSVATAGSKAGGRGSSLTFFHGSEAAFWPNAQDHFAASVQAIPLAPGTEVILESTSAGASGEFYERCADAQNGVGDYILIFLPWWISEDYQRPVPMGFELSLDEVGGEMSEAEYAAMFAVDDRRMAWRRSKIEELRDPLLFRREYPATVEDAWTSPPGHEPYINALTVLRARKRKGSGVGPLVLGVDPAGGGGDRFAVAARRGLQVEWVRYRNKLNHEEGVAWVRSLVDEHHPARVNIDAGNVGANMVTTLKNIGPFYADLVRGVNFGGTSEWRLARPKVPGPFNRRAEMWSRLLEWLELPEGAILPDDGAIQSDICAPMQKPRLDNFFMLESKVEMRKRGVRSPDLADAIALTFAFNEYIKEYRGAPQVQRYGDIDAQPHLDYGDALVADDGLSGIADGWMA
jgi:hypothetical protein